MEVEVHNAEDTLAQITVRLDRASLDRIERLAQSDRRSVSSFVRLMVQDHLAERVG